MKKGLILVVLLLGLALLFISPWGVRPAILRYLHIKRCQLEVIAPLELLTREREDRGLRGRYCLSIAPEKPTEFLIVSNLHGERESFDRLLNEWKAKGFISSDWKLKERVYLILNGNIIGAAPDAMQMLATVARLMKANPERLFYIRGSNEDKDAWLALSLGKEIAECQPESDVLANKFRSFLTTLPLCLYIFPLGRVEKPLRVSYFGRDNEDMERSGCYRVEQGDVKAFCSLDHRCSFMQPALGPLIVGEERGIKWRKMMGLQFIASPPAWHVVSSPRTSLKQLQRYFVDSYVVLSLNEVGKGDTLTLYHNLKDMPAVFIHDGVFKLD